MRREGMVVIFLMALATASAAGAATDAEKCAAAKNKIAGKYYFCLEKAEAKAVLKGTLPDYSKCVAKFDEKWNLEESDGGGMCPDNVAATADMTMYIAARAAEAAAIIGGSEAIPSLGACGELLVSGQTQCANGAVMGACPGVPAGVQDGDTQHGRSLQYTDNGDGTITDEVTGLVWEKLCDQDPSGATCPADHDFDTTYAWASAFTKIANMNAASYAGYADWRLPNVRELESLIDRGRVNPSADPIFHTGCTAPCAATACSCTRLNYYWSATTSQGNPTFAWLVVFADGIVGTGNKLNANGVRAVRGGS